MKRSAERVYVKNSIREPLIKDNIRVIVSSTILYQLNFQKDDSLEPTEKDSTQICFHASSSYLLNNSKKMDFTSDSL